MNLNKIASLVIILLGIFLLLIYGRELLIPFVIAVLVWYLINAFSHWVSKFKIGKKPIPYWAANCISGLSFFLVLIFVGGLITENVRDMYYELPKYEKNMVQIADKIGNSLPALGDTLKQIVSPESLNAFKVNLFKLTGEFELSSIITNLLNTLSGLAGNTFLIVIYLMFLFFEQAVFPKKIRALIPQEDKFNHFYKVIDDINDAIRAYFKVKISVSLVTATASYLLMTFIGLDFALFWAFLIFLLNFIPNIGSLIATIFPALLALVQFEDSFLPFMITLVGVGTIQLIVGNFLEPRMMGSSLNISSLAVILSLTFWGALWGIPGMILCVPITVILMIILAQFPSTRPIALLLSENGELMDELEEINEAS